jgi:hypothetical protein
MRGRQKGAKNKKRPPGEALQKAIEEALGEEQVIPELKKARKQYKRLIKQLLWYQEDGQGQK